MSDIQFYHLTSIPLERILPKLLEKSLQAGFKALVKTESPEKAEGINSLLWTYNPDSFLPHGTQKDGRSESQPIYITSGDENPNDASLFIVTDGTWAQGSHIKRVLDLVDARDASALENAVIRQQKYQAEGHSVTCVRQNASGGWENV